MMLREISIQIRMRTVRLFTYTKLIQKSHYVLSYANEPLKVLEKLIIDVSYENKIYNRLSLYVIKGSGVNLLGRN